MPGASIAPHWLALDWVLLVIAAWLAVGVVGVFALHRFELVSGLVTNFHLPKSSLLFLAAAFAGREEILAVYRDAVQRRYRFYSYGDAMLIV